MPQRQPIIIFRGFKMRRYQFQSKNFALAWLLISLSFLPQSGLSLIKKKGEGRKRPTVEDFAEKYFKNKDLNNQNISQKKADQLRLKTISAIQDILKGKMANSHREFELLFRLGNLYVERHDYLRALEIEQFSTTYDQWVKNVDQVKKERKKLKNYKSLMAELADQEPSINHNDSKKQLVKWYLHH